MHTHAARYACNPQLVICSGPLTPVSGGVGSSRHSDLRGHQKSQCSLGGPRGVGMRPSTWTPPPGTSGGSTNTLPSPGEGWRSWVAPASSSASSTGARTDSDGASFVGGCGGGGGEEEEREVETENQYIQSITQSTHFLAVWPCLITDRQKSEGTHTVTTSLHVSILFWETDSLWVPVFLNMCEGTGNNKAAHCESHANKWEWTPQCWQRCHCASAG